MVLVDLAGFALGVIYGFYYVIYSSRYLLSLVCTLLFLFYVLICLYFHFCQVKDFKNISAISTDQIDRDELEEKYDDKTEDLLM